MWRGGRGLAAWRGVPASRLPCLPPARRACSAQSHPEILPAVLTHTLLGAQPYTDHLSWGARGPPGSTHGGLKSQIPPKSHTVPQKAMPHGPLTQDCLLLCAGRQAGSTHAHSPNVHPGHCAAWGGWKGHLSFVPFLLLPWETPAVSSHWPELHLCAGLPSHLCKQRIQRETLG